MQWLLANLFLVVIVLIGAGSFWLVGFTMWSLNLPPDDHPGILTIGCAASIFITYYIGKHTHRFLQRHL